MPSRSLNDFVERLNRQNDALEAFFRIKDSHDRVSALALVERHSKEAALYVVLKQHFEVKQ
jgi:hypothetical protein